jgi:hypothetical protein
MPLRAAHLGLLSLLTIPLLQVSCGSSDDRKFAPSTGGGDGGGVGGTGAGGTGAGTTGGSAGSSATGGVSGSGTGGTTDGGTPCTGNAECDDKNACNGAETCDGGSCKSGTALADGEACTPDYGDAGAPDGGEPDFVCATGVCALKCTTDADCEDNDVCTGKEICHPTSKTCLSGTPLACDDTDVCTDNQCDAATGCFYPLIDADMDGHAATSLGSCGDDCNDNDATIYTGAAEACDQKDNNCNNATDETAPTWYPDCDNDGFAPAGAPGTQQCLKPAAPDASCGASGGWTIQVPAAGTTDCWDKDANAHPMTASQNNTAWQDVAMSGGAPVSIDFDYNCDTTEEKAPLGKVNVSTGSSCTYATGSSCFVIIGANAEIPNNGAGGAPAIEPSAAGGIGGIGVSSCCLGSDGWTGSGPTTCGGSSTYTECKFLTSTSCYRTTYSKKLECR